MGGEADGEGGGKVNSLFAIEVICFMAAGWLLRALVANRVHRSAMVSAQERAWADGYKTGVLHTALAGPEGSDEAFMRAAGVRWDGADVGKRD